MRLRTICYPVHTLGPGRRVGIWLSGCKRNCPGCMSPELAQSLPSDEQSLQTVFEVISQALDSGATGITISGGEPFDQEGELLELIEWLNRRGVRDIICYTGYLRSELESRPIAALCISMLSVLVDGPYVVELDDSRGLRGSSNQVVHRIDPMYDFDFENARRSMQAFVTGESVFVVGLR